MRIEDLPKKFTKFEWYLLTTSILAILIVALVTPSTNPIATIASIIGAISLIFVAKGNYFAFVLVILFCVLYSVAAYSERAYSEMINLLAIEVPFAFLSFFKWKNVNSDNSEAVEVNNLKLKEYIILIISTIIAAVPLYFLFKYMNIENILVAIFAILSLFIASYLLLRRSKYYAVAFILNDIFEILFWIIIAANGGSSSPIIVLFFVYLFNDTYGLISWFKRAKK